MREESEVNRETECHDVHRKKEYQEKRERGVGKAVKGDEEERRRYETARERREGFVYPRG